MTLRPASLPWSMRLPKLTSYGILIAFVFCLAWFILVVTAPMMVPSNTLLDLSGKVGTHENDALFRNLSAIPHAVYWIGDGECHTISERSFYINGNQMPFCARDTGLFLGLLLGFAPLLFVRYRINPFLALIGLVPMGIDGGLQLVTSYESNNLLRLATGLIGGVACAMLLALFIFAIKDSGPSPRSREDEPRPDGPQK